MRKNENRSIYRRKMHLVNDISPCRPIKIRRWSMSFTLRIYRHFTTTKKTQNPATLVALRG